MTTVLKNIFFIASNWLLTCVWQDFVTVKKYRLVSIGNGQLSTRTRVILLRATPVGQRPNRAVPGCCFVVRVSVRHGGETCFRKLTTKRVSSIVIRDSCSTEFTWPTAFTYLSPMASSVLTVDSIICRTGWIKATNGPLREAFLFA